MTILIAEDDPHLRNEIVDLLTLEGLPCLVAEDGAKALALFQQSRPDLCVFDVMMPNMDGLTLCREIRRIDPLVPILLLSARGEETDRVRGLDVGADDYVAKPSALANSSQKNQGGAAAGQSAGSQDAGRGRAKPDRPQPPSRSRQPRSGWAISKSTRKPCAPIAATRRST